MIFVVCKYERWARHWFNEFASRCDSKTVDGRRMKIKLPNGRTVQFVGENRFNQISKGYLDVDVIFWDEFDESIDDLEVLIERKM